MKRTLAILVSLFLIIGLSGVAIAEGQNGTTLSAGISLHAKYERVWTWDIDKAGSLDKLEYYMNEDPLAAYTVSLFRYGPTTVNYMYGTVTVSNSGSADTEGLSIQVSLYERQGYQWVLAGIKRSIRAEFLW